MKKMFAFLKNDKTIYNIEQTESNKIKKDKDDISKKNKEERNAIQKNITDERKAKQVIEKAENKKIKTEYNEGIKKVERLKKYFDEQKYFINDGVLSSIKNKYIYLTKIGKVKQWRTILNIPEIYPDDAEVYKYGRGEITRLNDHERIYWKETKINTTPIRVISVFDDVTCEKEIKKFVTDNNWKYDSKNKEDKVLIPGGSELVILNEEQLKLLLQRYNELELSIDESHKIELITIKLKYEKQVEEKNNEIEFLNKQVEELNTYKDSLNNNNKLSEETNIYKESINDKNKLIERGEEEIKRLNKKLKRRDKEIKKLEYEMLHWTRNENNKRLERLDEKEE